MENVTTVQRYTFRPKNCNTATWFFEYCCMNKIMSYYDEENNIISFAAENCDEIIQAINDFDEGENKQIDVMRVLERIAREIRFRFDNDTNYKIRKAPVCEIVLDGTTPKIEIRVDYSSLNTVIGAKKLIDAIKSSIKDCMESALTTSSAKVPDFTKHNIVMKELEELIFHSKK